VNLNKIKNMLGLRLDQCQTMPELRQEIDILDQKIVEMIAIRKSYMDQAAIIKKKRDQVRDEDRVEDVISKITSHAHHVGADSTLIVKIYRQMIEWSINYELDKFDEANK
jgi:isochorismate pyruvate lyase